MFSDLKKYEILLPEVAPESLNDLSEELRIYKDKILEVWFSPRGVCAEKPQLWILGITPGWNQMRIAYEEASNAMQQGLSRSEAIKVRKPNVAFAGSMRKNLVSMLDELDFAKIFDVPTSTDLFGSEILRTGSVLKYPVFKKGANYTGHSPKPTSHPVLVKMIDEVLGDELDEIGDCLILPLGKSVEYVLDYLVSQGRLDQKRILNGFPHPSGANGHRKKQFAECKKSLKTKIKQSY
ncbi:MAG: hypothetical protein AB8D52_09590 [Gammaproteobacteria bacterium]